MVVYSSDSSSSVVLPKPRRRRWLRVLGLLVIFAAGLGTGVALTVVVAVHRLEYAIHHPENLPPRLTKYLKRRLEMNDRQALQVQTIIAQRQGSLRELRVQVQPQVEQQLGLLREQIGAVLDDSQKLKWFEIFDRAKTRWVPAVPDVPTTQPE
jgi:hypothetical protein